MTARNERGQSLLEGILVIFCIVGVSLKILTLLRQELEALRVFEENYHRRVQEDQSSQNGVYFRRVR